MTSLATHIRGLCKAAGLHIDTSQGQHFLIDQAVLDALVEAANVSSDTLAVEIGPGLGVLTAALLQRGATVHAIETDARLIELLPAYLAMQGIVDASRLHITHGNALHVPFPDTPYRVIANIPYHITSPLLRHALLESSCQPTSMTLLIQREVAEKICDTKQAGLLTILTGLFGKAHIVRVVPPDAFLPPPAVDSAILHVEGYDTPIADRVVMEQVWKLAKLAFAQKRKMLRNTLALLPGGADALQAVGIDQTRRPQTLTLQEWIALAMRFSLEGSAQS